jgi:hypothetical protein
LVADPILIVVVELVVPPVPILIALVNAPDNAAVAILVVEDAPVAVDPCVKVVVPAPNVKVVGLANAANVEPPSIDVVNVGAVANAILPDPVTFWPSAPATPVPKEVMPVPPFATGSVPVTLEAKLT